MNKFDVGGCSFLSLPLSLFVSVSLRLSCSPLFVVSLLPAFCPSIAFEGIDPMPWIECFTLSQPNTINTDASQWIMGVFRVLYRMTGAPC